MTFLLSKNIFFLIFLLALHLFLLTNFRFTVWPEMILYPWLLNNDFKLYQNIVNPYFPFLPLVLASFFSLVGTGVLTLKLFTFLLILLTDSLLFYLLHNLTKSSFKSIFSLGVYILLQITFGGNGLWFELFIGPFLLIATYLIYSFPKKKNSILLAGLCLGLGVLTKQNAILFFIPTAYFLLKKKQFINLPYLFLPLSGLIIILLIYLITQNILNEFITWAIYLPITFSNQPGFVLFPDLKHTLIIFLLFIPLFFSKIKEKIYWGICLFLSCLFALPRYEDFHLQVFLLFSVILISFLSKKMVVLSLFLASLIFIKIELNLWQLEERFIDRQTIRLSQIIAGYDSVYILNGPELSYFFSDQLPPKVWASNFPWYFENNNLQLKVINDLKSEQTQYIVIGKTSGGEKFTLGNYLPTKIVEFINTDYTYQKTEGNLELWKRK